jgi:hypothetical protein
MNGSKTAQERYLELTALLIDREIAKFRRGEQAALVSFSNVARLAGNASNELSAPGTAECVGGIDRCSGAERGGRSAQARRR